MDLCSTFKETSHWVWDSLRTSRNYSHQIGEESITDYYLLKLKKSSVPGFNVSTYKKSEEAVNGADYEIGFVGFDGRYIGFRIQAKVIKIKNDCFEGFHNGIPRKSQLRKLLKNARIDRVIPLYAFYCNWRPGKYTLGSKRLCGQSSTSVRHYGVSVIPAFEMKPFVSKNSQHISSLLASFIPIQCLFCFRNVSRTLLVQELFFNFCRHLPREQRVTEDQLSEYVHETPPSYVTQLISSENTVQAEIDLPENVDSLIIFKANSEAITNQLSQKSN